MILRHFCTGPRGLAGRARRGLGPEHTCIWELQRAVRSATELRLSLLLSPVENSPPIAELSALLEEDRRAIVLVFSSAIRFLSVRISPLSFSASLLILMNCVRFW